MDADPTSLRSLYPDPRPLTQGKRCGKCRGFLEFNSTPRLGSEPRDADIACVNCGATAATWIEGQDGWTVRLQPR